MTLDELLALLPDNTEGQIEEADLRTIVTELYNRAHTVFNSYAYRWTDNQAPPAGRVSMDQLWQAGATKVLVSESSDDGLAPSFALFDGAADARLWLHTADGSSLEADVTGPSVDLGTYREIPIQVLDITGPAPSNNEAVTASLVLAGI